MVLEQETAASVNFVDTAKKACELIDEISCHFLTIDEDEDFEEELNISELLEYIEQLNGLENIPPLLIDFY